MRLPGTRVPRATSAHRRSETAESGSLVAVDAALAMASHRSLVTTDEALRLLRGVHAAVEVGPAASAVDRIIAEAARSYTDQMVLDREMLLNPLLDIRLAVCS
jgi:hypothetical protein